jgi:hypothetical protein
VHIAGRVYLFQSSPGPEAGCKNTTSDGELVAAFEYAALQHSAASAGAHPLSEAVHPAASSLFGLVRSLRHVIAFSRQPSAC